MESSKTTGMVDGVACIHGKPMTRADNTETYTLELATEYGHATFTAKFIGSDAWGADCWDVEACINGVLATQRRLKTIQAALDVIAKAPGVQQACE